MKSDLQLNDQYQEGLEGFNLDNNENKRKITMFLKSNGMYSSQKALTPNILFPLKGKFTLFQY